MSPTHMAILRAFRVFLCLKSILLHGGLRPHADPQPPSPFQTLHTLHKAFPPQHPHMTVWIAWHSATSNIRVRPLIKRPQQHLRVVAMSCVFITYVFSVLQDKGNLGWLHSPHAHTIDLKEAAQSLLSANVHMLQVWPLPGGFPSCCGHVVPGTQHPHRQFASPRTLPLLILLLALHVREVSLLWGMCVAPCMA